MNIRKWEGEFYKDLCLKYNSERTINCYHQAIKKFLFYFKNETEPKAIKTEDIKEYLLIFKTLNTRKQALCALKYFYKTTVGMPKKIEKIPYPKKETKLPKVVDQKVMLQKIESIKNLKHKSVISLAFATGMRVGEVVNLKIKNIDSDRNLILIENAKGNKDRYVPASDNLLTLLRKYYKNFRPQKYLFNGENSLKYTASSCNKIVKKYIGSQYHFHTLRHSCFTAMLENGVDLRIIQKIAGHKRSTTTEIYTHVNNNFLSQVKPVY